MRRLLTFVLLAISTAAFAQDPLGIMLHSERLAEFAGLGQRVERAAHEVEFAHEFGQARLEREGEGSDQTNHQTATTHLWKAACETRD